MSIRFQRWIRAAATIAAGTATVALAGGSLHPAPASADSALGCLWAGAVHRQGSTVYSGGWAFACHDDGFGVGRWSHDRAPGRTASVSSPGTGSPRGVFSPGAWQPGSEYNDYCVGDQLIDGGEAVYELQSGAAGQLYWHPVTGIDQWDFRLSGPRPLPTSRTASLCLDGVLS